MITLRGQILVSRIGDDPPPLPPPCVHPKRFPCLRSKRFRVYWHQAHMFPTCGLGAGTHGDVLNLHTESVLNVCTVFFFTFFHRAATHQTHTTTTNDTTTTTTPPPQRHTPHNTTRRQKQRETEKERQDKKAREEKRRDEKEERRRREKKKETMNRDKQFFRECPSAPELFSHQIPENVRQRRNYLAQMSEMSASTGIN